MLYLVLLLLRAADGSEVLERRIFFSALLFSPLHKETTIPNLWASFLFFTGLCVQFELCCCFQLYNWASPISVLKDMEETTYWCSLDLHKLLKECQVNLCFPLPAFGFYCFAYKPWHRYKWDFKVDGIQFVSLWKT